MTMTNIVIEMEPAPTVPLSSLQVRDWFLLPEGTDVFIKTNNGNETMSDCVKVSDGNVNSFAWTQPVIPVETVNIKLSST